MTIHSVIISEYTVKKRYNIAFIFTKKSCAIAEYGIAQDLRDTTAPITLVRSHILYTSFMLPAIRRLPYSSYALPPPGGGGGGAAAAMVVVNNQFYKTFSDSQNSLSCSKSCEASFQILEQAFTPEGFLMLLLEYYLMH